MQITITRSGGVVTLGPFSLQLSSLPPLEAARIEKLINDCKINELSSIQLGIPPHPDSFQFTVRVEKTGNPPQEVRFCEGSGPASLQELAPLLVRTAVKLFRDQKNSGMNPR